MAITISGTDGIVGAGFTVDNSGVSVTAGVGTFSSIRGTHHGDGANLTSLPAAQLTGTLPAISAANLTNVPAANITGTLPAISGANLTGITAGITMAQQWRITSNYDLNVSAGETVLSSNWETADNYGFGAIGSNLTNSSGTFSFPSTGIYLISASSPMYSQWPDSASSNNWGIFMSILVTTDNSSYNRAAFTSGFIDSPASKYQHLYLSYIFDVTNTSTHKFRISQEVEEATVTFMGDSNTQETGFSVIRLGDT